MHHGPELRALTTLLGGGRVVALTGAGMSTDSGIPDYRGPGSPARTPMTYQQFTGAPADRQRYWARSHVGWRRMERAVPNPGHRALARLEAAGLVSGLITQNVDQLHVAAGSRQVIELHGRIDDVVCLSCRDVSPRAELDVRLAELNPGWADREPIGEADLAPDGDAVVTDTSDFVVAGCRRCGGLLKPDLVFFGENVPPERVQRCYAMVDSASALLVAGSSLTVFSGRRFVRRAATLGIPVAVVNRGPTRGDEWATVRVEGGCSEVLGEVVRGLAEPDPLARTPADVAS